MVTSTIAPTFGRDEGSTEAAAHSHLDGLQLNEPLPHLEPGEDLGLEVRLELVSKP